MDEVSTESQTGRPPNPKKGEWLH